MNRNNVEPMHSYSLSHSFMCHQNLSRHIIFLSLFLGSLSNRFVNFCTFDTHSHKLKEALQVRQLVSNCKRSLKNSRPLNLGGTRAWARAPCHIIVLSCSYETTQKIFPQTGKYDRQMQLTVHLAAHFRFHLHYLTPIDTLKGDKIEYT